MKKNILTLIGSIIFSLIIIELFFIFFLPQQLSSSFRTYNEYGLALNKKNHTAFHAFRERSVKYKFGKYHNRIYNFPDKEKKILVLGDSFTFGWLLNDQDTFIYKLNKNFKNYYFVNGAAGGWGSSDQLRYLIDFCNLIKPKFVFVFINYLDFDRIHGSNLFYLDGNNELKYGKDDIPKFKKITENFFYEFIMENYHSIRFLKKKYVEFFVHGKTNKISKHIENSKPKTEKDKKEKVIEATKKEINKVKKKDIEPLERDINNNKKNYLIKKVFKSFKKETNNCGGKLIIINLAWKNSSNPHLYFLKDNKKFFEENNIKFIDLEDEMKLIQNNKSKYVIVDEGHPNKEANQILYNIIKDKIKYLVN
jgi:hypothetical protein